MVVIFKKNRARNSAITHYVKNSNEKCHWLTLTEIKKAKTE